MHTPSYDASLALPIVLITADMTQPAPSNPPQPHKTGSCANCGDQFGWHEVSTLLFISPGNTISCLVCATNNFLLSQKSVGWFIAVGVSLLFWATLMWGAIVAIPPTGWLSQIGLIFAFAYLLLCIGLATYFARILLKLYNLKTGRLSTDEIHQSIWDFG